MPEGSVNVWNLTQYLIARWELTPGSFLSLHTKK